VQKGVPFVTIPAQREKAWAVLAYTIAEDAATTSVLDTSAKRELKAICDAADFRRVSVAAQVDFKRRRGVYRSSLIEIPPAERGFDDINPEGHPLWGGILHGVDTATTDVRLQRDATDLNAADADVLQEFLRFGRAECPADRYVVSFFGHAALLVGGLGWSYAQQGPDAPYAADELGEPFGFKFSLNAFQANPRQPIPLLVP
jgi:hypothetical protein